MGTLQRLENSGALATSGTSYMGSLNAVDDRKDEHWHTSHEWLLALEALSRAVPERARPGIFHGVFCHCGPK
jgi:hypothetical protein